MANPNPYVDRGPWGVVAVSGFTLPGIVRSIDGAAKPEDWNVQKGTAKSGATTVWKGTKLAESMKILLGLMNADQFAEYYTARDTLRPKIGTKPPSHTIVNPHINFSDITRVTCRDVGPPTWVESGGYWTGLVELLEFNPPRPANTGVANRPRAGVESDFDPNADVKRQLDAALEEAQNL